MKDNNRYKTMNVFLYNLSFLKKVRVQSTVDYLSNLFQYYDTIMIHDNINANSRNVKTTYIVILKPYNIYHRIIKFQQ